MLDFHSFNLNVKRHRRIGHARNRTHGTCRGVEEAKEADMNCPILAFGLIATASMHVDAAPPAVDPKSLRQITGVELENLISNSAIQYGQPPIKGRNFSIYGADRKYKFVTPEAWGGLFPYHFDADKVIVETDPSFCVKVFISISNQYYIFVSTQEYAGYQPVAIHHLRSGDRM